MDDPLPPDLQAPPAPAVAEDPTGPVTLAPEVPPGLALVQDFVNTRDLVDGTDDLGDVDAARAWLSAHGDAHAAGLDETGRRRLVEVRELLRDLLEGNAGHPVDVEVAQRLDQLLSDVTLCVGVSVEGPVLRAACGGTDRFVAALAAAMVNARTDGTWTRLKVCRDDDCRWAFYDHSRNGSRAWCAMRVCGSRAKARTYRARRRSPAH